jgi:hypothetical protein
MDTNQFRLDCRLKIRPKWHKDLPEIKIFFGEDLLYHEKLCDTKIFCIEKMLIFGCYSISVEFVNKTNQDTIVGTDLDKAVIIESVEFNKITSDRFVWEGLYYPRYDPVWVEQQEKPPAKVLKYCNYLGWNGVWRLDFTMPIFTWIHQVKNYGWIYD